MDRDLASVVGVPRRIPPQAFCPWIWVGDAQSGGEAEFPPDGPSNPALPPRGGPEGALHHHVGEALPLWAKLPEGSVEPPHAGVKYNVGLWSYRGSSRSSPSQVRMSLSSVAVHMCIAGRLQKR